MTTPRFTPEELRQLHELAAQWTKIVSKRAFGDDGPGQDIVTATARFSSFCDATDAVRMAGIDISESQVRRLAHEVGAELIAERDRKVIEHRRRQLPARVAVIPDAVAAEVEGGRIRTRAAQRGPGVHDAQNKEDKVACLVTLTSSTFAHDPQPEPPKSFPCARRVKRLVTQMKGQAGEANPQEILDESADPEIERVEAQASMSRVVGRSTWSGYARVGKVEPVRCWVNGTSGKNVRANPRKANRSRGRIAATRVAWCRRRGAI